MLFCSYIFIFGFLPLTFAGYYLLGRWAGARAAKAWLMVASLCFYGWHNQTLLLIIGASMVANYAVLWLLERDGGTASPLRRAAMIFGVLFNLGLLGYYKYTMFAMENIHTLVHSKFMAKHIPGLAGFVMNHIPVMSGTEFVLDKIILPLGISFFTFQQIGCVVDIYRQRRGVLYPVVDYMLFVTFFPQLVAGPIVSHSDMMPQFDKPGVARPNGVNLAPGLHLFAVGLFKKLVIADLFAPWVDAGWALSSPSFSQAWFTIFAFMFQLYFDFSGYSDMAIGLGRMFNIHLPLNFNSPLRATSITDLWRRWHITLGAFLTQYVYIPLGGNRKGPGRAYLNLAVVFLLCGIWHGASWLFVIWGAINSVAMVAHRFWQKRGFRMPPLLGWFFTFAVWIPSLVCVKFNGTWEQSVRLTRGLFSRPEFSHALIRVVTPAESQPLLWMLAAAVLVFCFPNAATRVKTFRATRAGAYLTALLLVVAVFHITRESPFIYFNF